MKSRNTVRPSKRAPFAASGDGCKGDLMTTFQVKLKLNVHNHLFTYMHFRLLFKTLKNELFLLCALLFNSFFLIFLELNFEGHFGVLSSDLKMNLLKYFLFFYFQVWNVIHLIRTTWIDFKSKLVRF